MKERKNFHPGRRAGEDAFQTSASAAAAAAAGTMATTAHITMTIAESE